MHLGAPARDWSAELVKVQQGLDRERREAEKKIERERVLGTDEMRPTLIYNGYGDYVAEMYKGIDNKKERLFV